MAVELWWADTAVAEFRETSAEPDGDSIFATFEQARDAALKSAVDNRDQWAGCARELRKLSKKEALK